MTTDPFAEAARAEAEAVMRAARERVGITVQEQTRYVEGYVAGAEWAASREHTEEEVEAGMAEAANSMPAGWWGDTEWRRYVEEILDSTRAARRDKEK